MAEESPIEALEHANRQLKHFVAEVTTATPDADLSVRLSGYLDGEAANRVMEPLTNLVLTWAGSPRISVDLARLEYISSLGIGMLTNLAVSAHKRSMTMKLVNPRASVLHVLELLGIPQYIPVVQAGEERS